jgi:phage tail-like protein
MARHSVLDRLPAFRFHLLDVAPLIPPSVPIFLPQAGFSSITAPEVTADMEEINEGNAIVKRKVIKGVSVSPITLSRGATFYDSDFWRWFSRGATGAEPKSGAPRVRRNLLLVQFMQASQAMVSAIAAAGFTTVSGNPNVGAALGIAQGAISASGALGLGGSWRIPAKTWMLWGCLPSRWKSGTDFDASASEVSIAELDVEPELIEEFSIANILP